jgi:hypothetical protein
VMPQTGGAVLPEADLPVLKDLGNGLQTPGSGLALTHPPPQTPLCYCLTVQSAEQ